MARIAGVDLPRNKKLGTALTYIYGLGDHLAIQVLDKAGIDSKKKTEELTEDEVARIRDVLESFIKWKAICVVKFPMNIKRLMDLGCYRGLRHRKGLPVRGQREHQRAYS